VTPATLDLRPLFPAIVVALSGIVVLLAQAFTPKGGRAPAAALSLAGLAGALATVIVIANGSGPRPVLAQSLAADDFALFFQGLILAVGIVAVLLSPSYLRETGIERGEYYALVLFSIVGMLGLVSALELVAVFVALEIMSVAVYALAGLHRDRPESQEAALKYFITGSFSSAFFLYGVALLYGLTGHTSMAVIAQGLRAGVVAPAAAAGVPSAGAATALALVGVGFLLVGFGFKVASVPFHMWAPDAYEGAPTPVTGFMAAGVKAAAFGALIRLMTTAFASPALVFDVTGWANILAAGAAITMTLGNLAAVRQENVKRMLAYSSIGHAGYLLLGVVASGLGIASAKPAVLFYLVAYTFTTLGAFGVVAWIGNRKDERLFVDDWAGISAERPGVALAMTIFLLSLGGVPPTGGFFGKFYLFKAAMESPQLYWLVVLAVLNSVVSVYYYLRIVVAMYR